MHLIDGHADRVDEAHLHAGKLVFLIAVQHVDGFDL